MDRKERNTTPRPCSNDIILVDRDSLRKMLHLWISKYMDIEESKIEVSEKYCNCRMKVGKCCLLNSDYFEETNIPDGPGIYFNFTDSNREVSICYDRLHIEGESEKKIAVKKSFISRIISSYMEYRFLLGSIDKVEVDVNCSGMFDITMKCTPSETLNFCEVKLVQDITDGYSSLDILPRGKCVLYIEF